MTIVRFFCLSAVALVFQHLGRRLREEVAAHVAGRILAEPMLRIESRGQADGSISRKLPAIAVLYTLYARACDPVLEFLQMGGEHSDEEIIELVMGTCFDGLNTRAG